MKRLLPIILCALLCASCTALPAEERSFAVALGISQRGPQWTVHARIPTYQTGGGYTTVKGEGDSLSSALAAADAASPMALHLGQLRLMIFSVQTAQTTALREALTLLSQRHDLRPDASVAVTEADMEALMEAMNPATGSRLSKSLDVLMETRISQGTLLPATMADILRMGERQQPVLMNLTLEGEEVGLSGGWPVSEKGFVSVPITPEESQLLSVMMGRMTSGVLSLAEGAVRLTAASAEADLSWPTMQHGALRLTLRYASSALTKDALSRSVATACLGVLNRLSGMGCDALGLGRQAMPHATDMAEWHEMGWPERYQDLTWSVSVGVEGPS